jgi:hypothetical protein
MLYGTACFYLYSINVLDGFSKMEEFIQSEEGLVDTYNKFGPGKEIDLGRFSSARYMLSPS